MCVGGYINCQCCMVGNVTLCVRVSCPQAWECFKKASPEVEKEEFLLRVAGADEEEAASSPLLQYYNKVGREISLCVGGGGGHCMYLGVG